MSLTMSEKIRVLLSRKNLNISDLATILGSSRQNLTNKLKRDNFKEKELHEIAKALDVMYEGYFIFDDGDKI